jgi:hypothetical protein
VKPPKSEKANYQRQTPTAAKQLFNSPARAKLVSRQGWTYKENMDFFLKCDRALASFPYLGALRISESIRIQRNSL